MAVSVTTMSIITDSLLVATIAGIMIWMRWTLALAALCRMPLLALIVAFLNKPIGKRQRVAMEKAAELESHMVETIAAAQSIKAYRVEDRIQVRAEARFMEMTDASFRSQVFALLGSGASALTAGLSGLSLLWFG